jgi:hypothetical protein
VDIFRSADETIESIERLSYLVEHYPGAFVNPDQLEKLEESWNTLENLVAEFHRRIPKK